MNLVYTSQFKKDYKRVKRQGKNDCLLEAVVKKLLAGEQLPEHHRDHSLKGRWKGRRECHIMADWLLVYCMCGDDLILERTGTHSELFHE